MQLEQIEEEIIRMSQEEINSYLMRNSILKAEMFCPKCNNMMNLEKCNSFVDKYAWRCKEKTCEMKYNRVDIRTYSKLEKFKISAKTFLKVLLRFSGRQPQYSILETINISKMTFKKIKELFIDEMKMENGNIGSIGGVGIVVNVDETMLNYKCKSHRGRSPSNKTDAHCIVETGIENPRAVIKIIQDKTISTIIPIIQQHVIAGTTIHTDEHKSLNA